MRVQWTAALVASVISVTPALAQRRCMVTDPTGTPLNVRAHPNGPIRGALHNGATVLRLDTVLDERGRAWTLVEPREAGHSGWVFREFVSCY